MNKEELNHIIEELESNNSNDEAYFAINQYGGGVDESYIQANKAGLELLAAQLLKVSIEFDDPSVVNGGRINSWDYHQSWLGGEIFIEYIQPVEKRQEKIATVYNPNFIQRLLLPIGCFGIAIILVGTFIAGIVTVIGWFI